MYKHIIVVAIILMMGSSVFAQDDERAMVDAPENIDVTGDASDILRQFEISGLIPSGAEMVVDEAFISLTTAGANFSTYATDIEAENFVMGATINFDPQADVIEACGIGGHIERRGGSSITGWNGSGFTSQVTVSLPRYLTVMVTSLGDMLIMEKESRTDDADFEVIQSVVDIEDSVVLTAVVLDQMMNVYVDGELAVTYEVDTRRGSWAFVLTSGAQTTRCSATDFFAYQIPDDYVFGLCNITSYGTVNMRTGPSTSFDRAGQLAYEETVEAVGQADDDIGFTWWQLDTGAWVREDVITAEGDCRTLPIVEAEL
ncbi:MAG: SH3 domain-containing protein [Chloroflexota bacterium]